jgi:signal transduction histidine kinase
VRRFSSLSGKVFFAFLVVLLTFGGVSAFGAYTMRRLGDEVQRVAGAYLSLRLELHDLQTRQLNLVQFVERGDEDLPRQAGFVKSAIDTARRYRKTDVKKIRELGAGMLLTARSPEEQDFLRLFDERLDGVEETFDADEALFDRVFGPPGAAKPLVAPAVDSHTSAEARQQLLSREAELHRDMGELMQALSGRVKRAEAQLERDEQRAVWATLLLSILAAVVGLSVMWLTQRAIRPLRRLADSSKEIARGDYRQRVAVGSDDEIGALAGEFNAMAAALEEREQRLIRSERLAAVGKIAAQITHEIRNPLSSIGLNAELLEEELGEVEAGEGMRKLARAIVKEVDRLAEITEQYLRFARLPRPRLGAEDLNALVSSLLAFQKTELEARRIALVVKLDPSLPAVACDENQIRQALLNLLRNAREAMQPGGQLTVTTSADRPGEAAGPRMVRVRIEGTGRVLTGEELRVALGRRLGWSVVKSDRFTVEQHGAQLAFSGEGFGHGVGLCEAGAAELARHGANYREILGRYFPGTTIEQRH